jgi:peptidoglycan/LPS O-acetylase OafA/YrhL
LVIGDGPVTYLGFAMAILGLSYEKGWLARLLSTRALVYGGEISFALYMVHAVVNVWAWELAHRVGLGNTATVLLTLAMALGGAVVVHHLIEKPANKWLRSRQPKVGEWLDKQNASGRDMDDGERAGMRSARD